VIGVRITIAECSFASGAAFSCSFTGVGGFALGGWTVPGRGTGRALLVS